MQPKRALTGENAERIDTRVMQLIYAFEDPNAPVSTGQLLDVYIEGADAPPAPATAAEAATAPAGESASAAPATGDGG